MIAKITEIKTQIVVNWNKPLTRYLVMQLVLVLFAGVLRYCASEIFASNLIQ